MTGSSGTGSQAGCCIYTGRISPISEENIYQKYSKLIPFFLIFTSKVYICSERLKGISHSTIRYPRLFIAEA